MSIDTDRGFLAVGGVAAAAGIASAIAGLIGTAVPVAVPVIGGLLGLAAMKLGGVLDHPEHVLLDPSGMPGKGR